MPPLRACLVDVYDTILASAFPQRQRELAAIAGVADDLWRTEWLRLSLDRDVGALSMAAAFERALAACGRDPDPALVSRLVARDAELIISHTTVFADTVPFLAKARAAGLGIALVSNCAENTRALLAAKGLLDLTDAAILSCEAGLAKPDPEIYVLAVQALGVSPGDAVMLDDQPRFCAGATAAGLRAIQVARPEVGGQPPDPRFTPVTSLHDVLPLLSLRFPDQVPGAGWSTRPAIPGERAGRRSVAGLPTASGGWCGPHAEGRADPRENDSMTTTGSGPHVVVVGGGIAGLAAAFFLRGQVVNGAAVRVTVLEGSPRLGGKLAASQVAGVGVDEGAEALLARRPEGTDLIRAIGLGASLVPAGTTSSAIWTRGAMRPLPRRQFMGVPADMDELAATGVVSPAGVERARHEARLHRDGDISVAGYIGGALGGEIVDRLVDPLLGGVYAGRSEDLSFDATLAPLAAATRGQPTLTAAAATLLPPPQPSAAGAGSPAPVFVTLTTGLGTLPQELAKASGASVQTGAMVRELTRTAGGWRLTIGSAADPEYLDADAVILACPAPPAARLLAAVVPGAARPLGEIPYASMAIITLAYPAEAFPETARSGYLVPAVDGKAVKAVTFSTVKWPHLAKAAADAGTAVHVVRCSVGRAGEVAVLQRDDADLVALAAAELAEASGVTGKPADSRVTRWGGGLPQYNVGHVDRVARIRAAVEGQPGLAVAGAAYDGVGIPACVATARAAVTRVLAGL